MIEPVERPSAVVDINDLPCRSVELQPAKKLRIGSLARTSDVTADPGVRREFLVIAEALELSATAQLRNAASIGGNLMLRPRCLYFRNVSANCNRRTSGSGCAAVHGLNRAHAILGYLFHSAATRATDGATSLSDNGFKVELMKRAVERQLVSVAAMP